MLPSLRLETQITKQHMQCSLLAFIRNQGHVRVTSCIGSVSTRDHICTRMIMRGHIPLKGRIPYQTCWSALSLTRKQGSSDTSAPLLSSHVQFWNHHSTIMVDPDYPCISNLVEGFHRGFKTRVNRARP